MSLSRFARDDRGEGVISAAMAGVELSWLHGASARAPPQRPRAGHEEVTLMPDQPSHSELELFDTLMARLDRQAERLATLERRLAETDGAVEDVARMLTHHLEVDHAAGGAR
jgi:hypothetical protein